MDINIGQHCQHVSCQRLDFLPFKCDYCKKYFCQYHREPSNHNCNDYLDYLDNYVIKGTESKSKYQKTCSHETCDKTGISNINECLRCGKYYCLEHRFPELHGCGDIDQKPINPKKKKNRFDRCEFM